MNFPTNNNASPQVDQLLGINGVNDRGTLVGFYTDSAGNTDGLLAKAAN